VENRTGGSKTGIPNWKSNKKEHLAGKHVLEARKTSTDSRWKKESGKGEKKPQIKAGLAQRRGTK